MKFQIGDVAIGQNFTVHSHLNGMECEIVSPLKECTGIDQSTGHLVSGLAYNVVWADGLSSYTQEFYLKKRPPANTPSEWEDSDVWQPEKELVYV